MNAINEFIEIDDGCMRAEVESSKGFYIGDICYVLGDAVYDAVWGANEYRGGQYLNVAGTGISFAVAGTASGDGCYSDGDNSYPVDSGTIGIIPLELLDAFGRTDMDCESGCVIEVNGPTVATFDVDDGVFDIRVNYEHITIDTSFDDDDWCDDEEE